MLAYNTDHLDNAAILQNAKKWFKNKLINKEGFETIKAKYPNPLYTPNFFIRIGLFIFTCISLSAANGLFLLVTGGFEGSESSVYGIRFIVHGIGMIAMLEALITSKKLFRCGIDDALLYSGASAIIAGFCTLFYNYEMSDTNTFLLFSLIALPFLIAATIRYADIIAAICSFLCLFTILFILISKTGEISKFIMPFIIMILSAFLYLQITKFRGYEKFRFWDSPLVILEIMSLVLFYLAGNYYIVRTLSEELFNMHLEEGEDIPLAFIFYAYTAIIPLAYVFFGLKNKNRVLLQTGLVLIAAAVLTFKYYFSLGHHEITLTISGILMIAVAWGAIRYLKTPQHGITYIEDKDESMLDKFDSEALIIAQTFSGPQSPADDGTKMGGGKFGGGGADADF